MPPVPQIPNVDRDRPSSSDQEGIATMSRSNPARSSRPRPTLRRRTASLLMTVGLSAVVVAGIGSTPALAATTCDPGADQCSVVPDSVQTPLGLVTVTVSEGNVVTVALTPTSPGTVLLGIPFALPPGPPCRTTGNACGLPGHAQASIDTTGGLVVIDTVIWPTSRLALPNLAIVSIHPPGPCRAQTNGMTVVFTPIVPPGPPA